MDAIGAMMVAPFQPWDAVICTSRAARATIEHIHSRWSAYLAERTGGKAISPVQLPVIPLGVECDEFAASAKSESDRAALRSRYGIGRDDVAVLFMGRLSYHAKAHPLPLYLGLEEAAARTQKRVHLIQAGWFANELIEKSFVEGAKIFCPGVRALFLDGREPADSAIHLVRRRYLRVPLRQHSGNLRPDSGRGDGGGTSGCRERLGRIPGYGSRQYRWDHDSNLHAAGRERRRTRVSAFRRDRQLRSLHRLCQPVCRRRSACHRRRLHGTHRRCRITPAHGRGGAQAGARRIRLAGDRRGLPSALGGSRRTPQTGARDGTARVQRHRRIRSATIRFRFFRRIRASHSNRIALPSRCPASPNPISIVCVRSE